MSATKKRLVIAGFGDTGLLVAIHLAEYFDIVGISAKPCLVSGQELGMRLTQPEQWKRDYFMAYGRYQKLADVLTLQGEITGLDSRQQTLKLRLLDGKEQHEQYDALLIASGVSNGFWRNNTIESKDQLAARIVEESDQLLQASTVAVVGGGATGVSVAANLASQYAQKTVHLFYSQPEPLPGYHPKVRQTLEKKLKKCGVQLHPGYRAQIPEGFDCDRFSQEAISWSTGQDDFTADITLWAIGKVKPNNAFIPASMLDDDGFVRTDEYLRVEGHENIFCVGDIAASDPNRSSARNWGWRLVANNIRAVLGAKPDKLRRYKPSEYRWGSILGVQSNGLKVFQPNGGSFRFPRWVVNKILFPFIVRKQMYRGVDPEG